MLDALLLAKTPSLLKSLYPACTWSVNTPEKRLYLTFDDGPIPEVTPFVLDELKKWKAKATFFCIGKNIKANPEIFERILREKHSIGNHTYGHLNGWKNNNKAYFNNIEKCSKVLAGYKIKYKGLPLFRPPYGKLKPSQYKALKQTHNLIMWDVLTFDFDLKSNKKKVAQRAIKYGAPGSIIVFHDSIKAGKKMMYALPLVLEHFTHEGYTFEKL